MTKPEPEKPEVPEEAPEECSMIWPARWGVAPVANKGDAFVIVEHKWERK